MHVDTTPANGRPSPWSFRRQLAAMLLIGPGAMLAFCPQAGAHESNMQSGSRYFYVTNTFCVEGSLSQDHTWHSVFTEAEAPCTHAAPRDPGYIGQYQQYYKEPFWGAAGTYCGDVGWVYNTTRTFGLYQQYNWDIWSHFGYACNYGPGVNVTISIDSWQAAAYGPSWYGGNNPWRPATHHCHCP
jgi:hypothetical protein